MSHHDIPYSLSLILFFHLYLLLWHHQSTPRVSKIDKEVLPHKWKNSDLTHSSDMLPSLSAEAIMVYLCASLRQLVVDPKECLKERMLLAFQPLM